MHQHRDQSHHESSLKPHEIALILTIWPISLKTLPLKKYNSFQGVGILDNGSKLIDIPIAAKLRALIAI
jgi:hypothetical protein